MPEVTKMQRELRKKGLIDDADIASHNKKKAKATAQRKRRRTVEAIRPKKVFKKKEKKTSNLGLLLARGGKTKSSILIKKGVLDKKHVIQIPLNKSKKPNEIFNLGRVNYRIERIRPELCSLQFVGKNSQGKEAIVEEKFYRRCSINTLWGIQNIFIFGEPELLAKINYHWDIRVNAKVIRKKVPSGTFHGLDLHLLEKGAITDGRLFLYNRKKADWEFGIDNPRSQGGTLVLKRWN